MTTGLIRLLAEQRIVLIEPMIRRMLTKLILNHFCLRGPAGTASVRERSWSGSVAPSLMNWPL